MNNKMYVTFCVDCSNDMDGTAIQTVNRIVAAFMRSVLEQKRLANAVEYLFTGCRAYENQQFQRPEDMRDVSGRLVMKHKWIQIAADSERKLSYPVFQTGDMSRCLSITIDKVHKAQITKMNDSRKCGVAVYTGLLLVIADGGEALKNTGPDEMAISKKLAAYCTGQMAEQCHIVPILIDLHGESANNRLKQLSAGFPDSYVRLGPDGRDDLDLRRCFSAILTAVNQSISSQSRREQVNATVASELKKLKNT